MEVFIRRQIVHQWGPFTFSIVFKQISIGSPLFCAPLSIFVQAGVVHFTRSTASTLARRGIRLMCVCPEFVDTPLVCAKWGEGDLRIGF